jgi:hypothetical protein
VDGVLDDGFSTGFNLPGVINGIPRPDAAPDADLLGDLLRGVKAAPGLDRSGAFVGTIELGAGWTGVPATVRSSKVRLRIEPAGGPNPLPGVTEVLFGSYSFTVDAPGIAGDCSLGFRYNGTFNLENDEVGFSGTTLGDATALQTDVGGCAGNQPFNADWSINVLRTSDTSVSGQMTFRALTVTFSASVPSQ